MQKRGKKAEIIIAILIVLIAIAVYITFFYSQKCNDIACWETKLVKCSKANFLSEKNDVIWKYNINGKRDGSCEVNVQLIEVKRGLVSTKVLEGKSMNCRIPLGAITTPEANVNFCHGQLKEEMQALIINKLHEYIVQNLGSINENILNPISGSSIVSNSTNSSS